MRGTSQGTVQRTAGEGGVALVFCGKWEEMGCEPKVKASERESRVTLSSGRRSKGVLWRLEARATSSG